MEKNTAVAPAVFLPIVNDLFAWLEEQEPCCPPDGPLNKAINYILNRRDELSCFLVTEPCPWTIISASVPFARWSWGGKHGYSPVH
ncbi:transposase [Escherichia coli]|nr:transposase [Escherichia coli]